MQNEKKKGFLVINSPYCTWDTQCGVQLTDKYFVVSKNSHYMYYLVKVTTMLFVRH